LIHCGDFCSFRDGDLQTLRDVDDWFSGLSARNVVCVGGNHDHLLQRREFEFTRAQFLEDRLIEVMGLRIYGSPWCPDLSGFAYYARESELIEHWRRIPSGIDILITHTPPRGILDVPSSGDIHLGCPHLRNELKRIQPRLHVFGHIHASHGRHEESGTQYVNAHAAQKALTFGDGLEGEVHTATSGLTNLKHGDEVVQGGIAGDADKDKDAAEDLPQFAQTGAEFVFVCGTALEFESLLLPLEIELHPFVEGVGAGGNGEVVVAVEVSPRAA
jgi:hypothetical protein